MVNYKKIEIILLLLILIINLGFIFYILGSSNISGFSVFQKEKEIIPSDFLKEEDIFVDSGKIILKIDNPVLSRYTDSDSMAPVLGKYSTGIGKIPKSSEEINIGDIISFTRNNLIVVHRVVDKGIDKEGVYFITKGDNNLVSDGKIRFEEIDSVLVGIIY